MSDLIVMTFDNVEDARDLRASLRTLQQEGRLRLDDAVVIQKDASGEVRVADEIDKAVKIGALAGGALGLLLSFLFPIAGLVIGAGGGALVGKLLNMGVDKNFIRDVTESLQPGTSALFVLVSDRNIDAALAAIRPYQGTLHQTTLPTNLETELRAALD